MNARRLILALVALLPMTFSAVAADAYRVGEDYERVRPTIPVTQGKIEVTELFWYGCPHCYSLEPYVEEWLKNKPDDVEFVRIPAIFTNPGWELHARAYYAAEVLGVLDKFHTPFFDAIHEDLRPMKSESEILAFVADRGIDRAAFKEAMGSFAVAGKVRRAADLTRRYGIDGVPALAVGGKYRTGGKQAKTYHNMIRIIDHLVQQERAAP